MSLIASLARAYKHLPDRPPFGGSLEKIGLLVSLHADGAVAHVTDLRLPDAKGRLQPRPMLVPQPVKRTVGIAPNFLWDKTSYALGVTAGGAKRTAEEHAAFVRRHEEILAGANDEGLSAFLAFLRAWSPEQFQPPLWKDDDKDQNVVFGLESERLRNVFLHDRPAAQAALARATAGGERATRVCLATGEIGPVARLHPSIKGVRGAQSSGAALISFNHDAFASYGHEQGDNAQIGERAAFAYTTALNRFLARDSGHRLQIGDAATVFWADAADAVAAALAEAYFGEMIEPQRVEAEQKREEATENRLQTGKIHNQLQRLARGEPLAQVEPALAEGVRFFVVGLAPNAARLSVRFYVEDTFGALADNYRAYCRDIAIAPAPDHAYRPSLARLAARTAPARRDAAGRLAFDLDAVSPRLAGELLRAVLTGSRFPRSLLSTLLMRVRSDGVLDALRVSLIKAVILRDRRLAGAAEEDYLMRSDPEDPNPARRLGRLFALIEKAQRAALGDAINSTVADKFLGAASATPMRVMPALVIAAQAHHIGRLTKGHSDAEWIKDDGHAKAVGRSLERDIGRLMSQFDAGLPSQLNAEEQGLFLIGYYQERWGKSAATDKAEDAAEEPQP
jgi:CRISPR-associated protein Csd1